MTVRVHLNRVDRWEDATAGDAELLIRAAEAAVEAVAGDVGGEISVTLLEGREMAGLNESWLDRTGPTDVVAFDLGGGEAILGDVYVCPEVAVAAVEEGDAPSLREELVRLVIHGILHVLGHEHPEGNERWDSPMFALQERLVTRVLGEAGPDTGGPG